MKTVLCASILAAVSAVTAPFAAGQSTPSQQGTIVSVQKQKVATPPLRTGADVDRSPLQSYYYLYNVSVQLTCEVYNLRYESELDDLPSALSADNRVSVRLKKNVIYLDFPGDTVPMRIVHHKVNSETACEQRRPSNRVRGSKGSLSGGAGGN
jgi:hypothetical protein